MVSTLDKKVTILQEIICNCFQYTNKKASLPVLGPSRANLFVYTFLYTRDALCVNKSSVDTIFTNFYNCPPKLISNYSAQGGRGISGSCLGSFDFIRDLCQILDKDLNLKLKNGTRKHNQQENIF